MNEEITYERNLTGSYMKLPADQKPGFDEKMLLKKKLPGLLAMEKCYMDGGGQYWYNISGKQSLDTYCRIRNIGIDFVERVIVSICSEIEILDRNLIDANCLLLGEEQIFVTNQNQEIVFAAYPKEKEAVSAGFQQLMEYLLTKIDHKDQDAVQMAYTLYEKTLDEGYSIMDIRDSIIERRKSGTERDMEKCAEEEVERSAEKGIGRAAERDREKGTREATERVARKIAEKSRKGKKPAREEKSVRKEESNHEVIFNPGKELLAGKLQQLYGRMQDTWEEWRKTLEENRPGKKITCPEVVYPGDELSPEEGLYPKEMPASHPTVCLSDYRTHPEGLLLYEGYDNFQDIRLSSGDFMIGNGEDVDIAIDKETISHYHAQIKYSEQEYYIEDLNSTNGTYVNEDLLIYKERRKLKSNDIIRFADVKYRFV